MKNKFKILIIIIILIVLSIILGLALLNKKNINNNIKDNYIAVFHGGSGEITYETYIYKIDNGEANYGFEYINVTSTTEFWGSPNWTYKITDRGKFNWTDEAFIIAKKNGAFSYVTVPNDSKIYTIEEFQDRFLMN
ncbi:MAG: hypothetical protein ACI4XR_02590 [Bacilli bacterium]